MTIIQRYRRLSLWPRIAVWGSVASFAGVVIGLIPFLSSDRGPNNAAEPKLEASLHLMVGGFWLRVANQGTSVAHNVHAEVVSWCNGAPDATIFIEKTLPDMPRGYDTRFHVDLFKHGGKSQVNNEWIRSSSSGYIVLTCSNVSGPKSWAFYLPRADSWEKAGQYTGLRRSWPLAPFDYATEKPMVSTTVNYPWVVDKNGWFPKKDLSSRESDSGTPSPH